ncbi:MAG: M28 family peptidase [Woeseia sp.]
MKTASKKSLFCLWPLCLVACMQSDGVTGGPAAAGPLFDGDRIHAHVALLADDLYEGREAGSRGYELAAAYVATQFRLLGLRPAGDDGYYQRVPFRASRVIEGSRSMSISVGGETRVLKTFGDYSTRATLGDKTVSITAPLVFVGHGVNAPSIEQDDFEGVDLNGKIALSVRGAPAALGSEKRAFYASGRSHKFRELEKRGAVGQIVFQHKPIASDDAVLRGTKRERFWWTDGDGLAQDTFAGLRVRAFLPRSGAELLFADSPVSFEDVRAMIEQNDYGAMELGITATITQQMTHRSLFSSNVVGVLEGSDPDSKNEYVVFSAHLDGVGLDPTGADDPINNGFYDNASGIGVMLEVARALAAAGEPPRRSILFLAVTAEEKGLLGSDYFAANPTVPAKNIVANVNMDMAMFLWRLRDVIAFGARHSTLLGIVTRAAERAGIELSPDPFPERGLFTRSDQFSFVRRGVPSIFLAAGFKTDEGNVSGEDEFEAFMDNHYHSPSDDSRLSFDRRSAAKLAEMNYYIGLGVANAEDRPRWNEDDFFGEMFGTEYTAPKK